MVKTTKNPHFILYSWDWNAPDSVNLSILKLKEQSFQKLKVLKQMILLISCRNRCDVKKLLQKNYNDGILNANLVFK